MTHNRKISQEKLQNNEEIILLKVTIENDQIIYLNSKHYEPIEKDKFLNDQSQSSTAIA